MNALLFLFSPTRSQWFCHLEGHPGYGRGNTQEAAWWDFLIHYPNLLGIEVTAVRKIENGDYRKMGNGGNG
jgi:hypothetical protein